MGRGRGAWTVRSLKTSGPEPDKKSMRPLPLRVVLIAAVVAATLIPARAAFAFSDVTRDYWDYDAITYMATTNTWMQDYGIDLFKPTAKEIRNYLARTLVEMYAPNEPIDPTITFPDLPTTDPFYPFANVVVKLDWIKKYNDGRWAGNSAVPTSLFDRAIINALGLSAPVAGLAAIHEDDGSRYVVGDRFPHMQLARWLGLHYNHDDESMDLQSSTHMPRDEIAYSLWTAENLSSWQLDGTSIFDDIALPTVSGIRQTITSFALNQIGFPYIWAGEWNAKSPPGYCCGDQPQGGMDCSGFVWWVEKKNEDNYNAAQFRTYDGWSVHQRSSSEMAESTGTQLAFADLKPTNLMFFASDGGSSWADVDHVGIYLGNDWMIHSTDGGPQIEWVGDGYYFDNFVYGRALKSTSDTAPVSPDFVFDGDPAIGP
jgi:hypothetical protein